MALASLESARFVLDVNGLDGLKRAASRNPEAQVEAAARQFEAMFLGQMLETMRDAGIQSDLCNSKRLRFYQSLFDQQLSLHLAGKGVGLADMLVRQLSGEPRSLAGTPALSAEQIARLRPDAVVPNAEPAPTAITAAQAPADGVGIRDRFVERFDAAARAAARQSGIPARLILAQAALESGWGRHQIPADGQGGSSHNLFGIKAGAGWEGPVAHTLTHEYREGLRVAVREPFRAYGSYAEAFTDHARLIGESPRYAPVREAATPHQAARALQECGYATDPHYADKLIAIMARLPESAK